MKPGIAKNLKKFCLFLLFHNRIGLGLWWIRLQGRRGLMRNIRDKFITSMKVMVNIFDLEQGNTNVL